MDYSSFLLKMLPFLIGTVLALFFLYFAYVSWRENEYRAVRQALILAFLLPTPYILITFVAAPWQSYVASFLLLLIILPAIVLLIPRKKRKEAVPRPRGRIDERDIMFSRNRLKAGSERFENYYKAHPEKREADDRFRQLPGLLKKGSAFYEPLSFTFADATFETTQNLHPFVDGIVAREKKSEDAGKNTEFILGWLKQAGTVSAGIAELKEEHFYSHVGRGQDYGKEVYKEHRYAIAFTVEMSKTMMDAAPYGPTVMESAWQYLRAATIAVQLAEFIRELGYPARAHIDGNYRVVCPLVARDAGLGEIGRMGLLMTPELGPRVRIGVVTTDIPLIPGKREYDYSVIDFCEMCKKCANVCPSSAISKQPRREINGVLRWQINQEACFTYWCRIGTDCGRCVVVCPYAHPATFLHNMVRKGIRYSRNFARFALWMDDFFYGPKPKPKPAAKWLPKSGHHL